MATIALAAATTACTPTTKNSAAEAPEPVAEDAPVVYFTKEITPESLVKIYKALGREATGRVAVKISTGEGGNTHYLKPTTRQPRATMSSPSSSASIASTAPISQSMPRKSVSAARRINS